MVDIEFIVQYLVLAHSHAHPDLTRNLGNIALLRMAGELGLIPAELAGAVADAYRTYRGVQHRLRLGPRACAGRSAVGRVRTRAGTGAVAAGAAAAGRPCK
jgi:glutamine synthetase adenylyltransferase